MRIILLRKNPEVYSGNAWLILGDSNTLLGVNALVDIGLDAFILDHLQQIFTGIGKKPLQKVSHPSPQRRMRAASLRSRKRMTAAKVS